MKCSCMLKFINFSIFCAEVAIFICVCILVSLSSKDPFKSHIIGSMSNYFNSYTETSTSSLVNMCICKNEIIRHSCTEENEFNGCFNITSDIVEFRPLFKRKLESGSF